MQIKIIPAAIFRVKCPELPKELFLEFAGESVSIQQSLQLVADCYGEASVLAALIAVNHVLVQDDAALLHDGDCLHLFSPAFGG